MAKRLVRICAWALGLLLAWMLVHTALSALFGVRDIGRAADYGVVFGSRVLSNGTPSRALRARLNAALNMYERRRLRWIVVSGARGREGWNEAYAMRGWLVAHGVPERAVIVDPWGRTTRATAGDLAALGVPRDATLCAVTQYYHVARACLALRQAGYARVGHVHADLYQWQDLWACGREFFAYYRYACGL